ncbi:CPBP family intramembrane glutamic endopeptidase [Nafulsella turpanensis]|uniref:CPBP family intramembrane glutamic endopeptidase n=1 Tax=Nafulsella turpanensis TaxID=1265690 RepID=UPI00034BE1DB|nr:CPBP family intramembrane glutamic endopeptidase [Nafulsella turpanensis]
MRNNGTELQDSFTSKPWRALFIIILCFFIGMFVGQFFGALLAMLLFDLGFTEVLLVGTNYQNSPNAKYVLYCLQFGSALGAFIIAPLFYLYRLEQKPVSALFNSKAAKTIPIVLTVFITLSFMVVNSALIEWNATVDFPPSMESFERILQEQEEDLRLLTEFLTTFDSAWDFIIALLVIAVLPAVGEELLFRGLIQSKLQKALGNPHVAIWLTAFIFGAIHFQFYGLVPRLFLGAIFGYIFYWSGSLLLPIVAHFINNGFSLLMYYLYQQGAVEYDVAETSALPTSSILVFLLLGLVAFWAFYWYFRRAFAESAVE